MDHKPRARDLGLDFPGTPGPWNAITDVAGVAVGFTTLITGAGALVPGRGPVRTGVTAILPHPREAGPRPVWAGFHALNGNGEMTGVHWINDAGYFVGPVLITNTHSVGIAHHAAVRWIVDSWGEQWHAQHLWAMPVVAETYDGVLNDINGQHLRERHVLDAIATATPGPVAEGNVGGGTGMICYEFKGGTGSASRRVPAGGAEHVVAALVQANHGRRDWLTVLGVPVGRQLTEDRIFTADMGSVIVIIATDIPMLPHQLRRVAKRAAIGVGRGGSPGGNDSGDIFLAFSVANPQPLPQLAGAHLRMEYTNDGEFDAIYLATVEAVEEAVVNALVAAEDMSTLRPPGRTVRAIDHRRLKELMRAAGRLRESR